MPKLKLKNEFLLIPPLGMMFFLLFGTSIVGASLTMARVVNVLAGVCGLLTYPLFFASFYFCWKLRKQQKRNLPLVLLILLVLSIPFVGAFALERAVLIFPLIAIIGIYTRSKLTDQGAPNIVRA